MHFVIIGNGGWRDCCAEDSRAGTKGSDYDHRRGERCADAPCMPTGSIDPPRFEPYERKMDDKQQIERITDWVVDLDATARQLRLKSDGLAYDRLLLATGHARKPA